MRHLWIATGRSGEGWQPPFTENIPQWASQLPWMGQSASCRHQNNLRAKRNLKRWALSTHSRPSEKLIQTERISAAVGLASLAPQQLLKEVGRSPMAWTYDAYVVASE